VRADLFRLHCQKRKLDWEAFALGELSEASGGFSGAEIEQAVVSALYAAHGDGQPLTQAHLLAALRGGIKLVLIPEDNRKDLAEIPQNVIEGLEIIPVSHVDEVLAQALVEPLEAIEWSEADDLASQPGAAGAGGAGSAATAH